MAPGHATCAAVLLPPGLHPSPLVQAVSVWHLTAVNPVPTPRRYSKEWEKTVKRLGRWIDFENDYKTLDPSFMESVWWVFSQLHAKGLVYRGFKVREGGGGKAVAGEGPRACRGRSSLRPLKMKQHAILRPPA